MKNSENQEKSIFLIPHFYPLWGAIGIYMQWINPLLGMSLLTDLPTLLGSGNPWETCRVRHMTNSSFWAKIRTSFGDPCWSCTLLTLLTLLLLIKACTVLLPAVTLYTRKKAVLLVTSYARPVMQRCPGSPHVLVSNIFVLTPHILDLFSCMGSVLGQINI